MTLSLCNKPNLSHLDSALQGLKQDKILILNMTTRHCRLCNLKGRVQLNRLLQCRHDVAQFLCFMLVPFASEMRGDHDMPWCTKGC